MIGGKGKYYLVIGAKKQKAIFEIINLEMESSRKLIAVIGDEDTVTGFILAGIGHRTAEGSNFLVVKKGI